MEEFHLEYEELKSEVDTYLTFLHSVISGKIRYIAPENEYEGDSSGPMIETEKQKVLKANFFFFCTI
jgi:hypothetical protein